MTGMGEPLRIAVVVGSTRPGNLCTPVAQWVFQLVAAQAPQHVRYELLQLPDLPLLDEPGIPAYDAPTKEHTRAWQAQVLALQGFFFVTPQSSTPMLQVTRCCRLLTSLAMQVQLGSPRSELDARAAGCLSAGV